MEQRFVRDPMEAASALARRHRHHGGGRRRVFDHGDLRFILLSMIAAKPAHGYDLIKALEERMGGGYSPSPGVIYPTLTMLEEQGYASVTAEDGKKLYRATDEGVAFLRANQAAVEAIQARIDGDRPRTQRGARSADHPSDREPENGAAAAAGRWADHRRTGARHRRRDRCGRVGGGAGLGFRRGQTLGRVDAE